MMTTYGFNLSFEEQEFWAIKEAMEFYLSAEATELRKKIPHLVKYAADIKLQDILSSGKLYKDMEKRSSNNFGQVDRQESLSTSGEESLFTIVIQQFKCNAHLLALAEAPVADMFFEHPTLNQFIRDCIIDCLDNKNVNIRFESKKLLKDDVARELFCNQIASKLYVVKTLSEK